MLNVFIDSNIWLSLYHFTNDDLKQFKKLNELVESQNGIKLFLPQQLYDEVLRNRDAKIKEAFTQFSSFTLTFPAFCKEYREYRSFSRDYTSLRERHKKWCEKIKKDFQKRKLPVDEVLSDFFKPDRIIECSDELIERAEIRYRRGNPPGKNNSIGDAINWECLLEKVPDKEDLYLISADKDYASALDPDSFETFLAEEWHNKKHSKVNFFRNLVAFLRVSHESIRLQNEQEKEELIMGLNDSSNFATTHVIISALARHDDWSTRQIEDLCSAAIDNTQVNWILDDEDVFAFYDKLLSLTDDSSGSIGKVKQMINELKK